MQRTVLAQEVVRILRNTRTGLPWDIKVKHVTNFGERIRMSGYSEMYRFKIVKSGLRGY